MAKKILFGLFAIAGAMMVYLISFWYHSSLVDINILKEANETDNYSRYLGVYTSFFTEEPIYTLNQSEEFTITAYKIVEKRTDQYVVGYVVFVSNLNTTRFKLSDSAYDEFDGTKLRVINQGTSNVVFDSKLQSEEDAIVSMTYGYQLYGGYFYNFYDISDNGDYEFSLYDYDSESFASFIITHNEQLVNSTEWTMEDFEIYFSNDSSLTKGFNDEMRLEILQSYILIEKVYVAMAIYASIVVGLALVIFLRKK